MQTNKPEYHSYEEFQNRVAKLEEIRAIGVEPYPHKFAPTASASLLEKEYASSPVGHSEEAAEGKTPHFVLTGRLILFRAMGKNAFGHIQDSTGTVQVMFNRDLTKVTGLPDQEELRPLKFIEKKIDLGDIVGCTGHLFRTQKGELTLFVKTFTLLSKSILPLPDKHAGLSDKGTRYRKRWLDLISNEQAKKDLLLRSEIFRQIRHYFEEAGFIEVETPILQNSYGGAAARPFLTHLNALDQEMFLRISLEIPLKKLLVGGLDRIYEIGKVFRNEGIDKTHNPEFTMLEAYATGWDYNDMMVLTETLFEKIALALYGTTILPIEREGTFYEIDVKAPWKRLSMKESIKLYGAIDVDALTDEGLADALKTRTRIPPDEIKQAPRGKRVAMLFEELAEAHLIQPVHIIDHPIETTPLCKLHRDPALAKEGYVERFESFILGGEFCNSYSELNDPVLQRKLLEEQADQKEKGDEEANPLDEEFIEAICQGMPPAGGLGIGLDRLTMLFTKVASIRDVLYFPIMRPEQD